MADVDSNSSGSSTGSQAMNFLPEVSDVKWDHVIGLEDVKQTLMETVIYPFYHPEIYHGLREPFNGILLYGPPGTGKSYIVKALSNKASFCKFYNTSASDLVSKYQGQSGINIKNLFETARENAPAIIFVDEIDSMLKSRAEDDNDSSRRIKCEFLNQLQVK